MEIKITRLKYFKRVILFLNQSKSHANTRIESTIIATHKGG